MSKLKFVLKKFAARGLFAVLAVQVLFSRASAQTAPEPPQRWLFVFDTSSTMKKRLPATKLELKNIFISSVSGELHAGDSVGVWTFNQKIRTGEFPLTTWMPQFAATVSSNLVAFLDRQHYSGDTRFAVLNQTLGNVINNSERLTIVIFCDGADTLKLTPYDDGINQTFQQMQPAQKKSGQPFVLVIRTQRGGFVGATVNVPPGNLDLPPFPPLPPPIEIAPPNLPPPPVIAPVPPPVIATPPLVIVGTNVGTNINDMPKIVPPPVRAVVTNSPPAAATASGDGTTAIVAPTPPPAPVPLVNPPETENAKPVPTSTITAKTSVAAAPTNSALATANGGDSNNDGGTRILIFVGTGLLLAAIVLILFLALHKPRARRESLITSSMQTGSQRTLKK